MTLGFYSLSGYDFGLTAVAAILTILGCIPWRAGLTFAGKQAADNWESLRSYLHWIDYAVIVAIVIGVVWLFIRWRRGRAAPADAPAA